MAGYTVRDVAALIDSNTGDVVGFINARGQEQIGIGQPAQRVRLLNTAALRWHDNAGGSVAARTEDITYSLKIEAEADFDAVALLWVNHEATPLNACSAVVAHTETLSTATQDSRYRPVVGGTTYNALRAAGDYGWDAVTWAGAATVNVPAGTIAAPGVSVSDWMPMGSVARADGGIRPLLLTRYRPPAASAFTYAQRDWAASFGTADANNRGRLLDVGQFAGDGIGTLANAMAVGIRSALVAPIFRFRRNVVTVANVGDSISMGSGSAAGLNNWCRRACYDLSTPTRPVVPMNMGMASQTTTTYLGSAKVILAAAKPSVAFYFPYSPNDAAITTRKVADCMARTADFIDFCNTNCIVPILATPLPNNTLNSTDDAFRVQILNAVRAMGAAGAVIVADFAAVTSDGATPARFIPGLNADTLHPNDAGHEAMSAVARAALARAISGTPQ